MNINPKEVKLLKLIADGLSTKEISTMWNLKRSSIEKYRNRMMKNNGARNAPHLVAIAYRDKIL